MTLTEARAEATQIISMLEPHCHRIVVAGSIRRNRPECNDIEIVCIPKRFDIGLFESGIATVINKWEKVKGTLPCKYTQRRLPSGTILDIFFANQHNWGYILAIRTGSAEYSHKILASAWVKAGYHGLDGTLYDSQAKPVEVREEVDLFNLIGVPWTDPENREL